MLAKGQCKVVINNLPYKKILLALALAVGLTSFAVNAPAETSTNSTTAAAVAHKAAPSKSNTKAEIAKLEQRWINALVKNDPSEINKVIFRTLSHTSHMGKSQGAVQSLEAFNKASWTSASISNETIKEYGSTVVVTGAFHFKGTDAGKPVSIVFLGTDTWVQVPGSGWMIVASHFSPAASK